MHHLADVAIGKVVLARLIGIAATGLLWFLTVFLLLGRRYLVGAYI